MSRIRLLLNGYLRLGFESARSANPELIVPLYQEPDPNGAIILIFGNRREDDPEEQSSQDDQGSHEEVRSKLFRSWCQVEECGEINDFSILKHQSTLTHLSVAQSESTFDAEEVSMRVSSHHLILASFVFKAMLSNEFKEATVLRGTERLELPLPDDDPAAFLILLNIIHGRLRSVPRKISFQMLTKISVLVDKYQFHEAVEVFTDMWIESLKTALPKELTTDVIPWLCISWVFKRPEEFWCLTRIFQYESAGGLTNAHTGAYPIPDIIINAINTGRESAVAGIVSKIQRLIDKYQGPETVCRNKIDDRAFRCDAMVLGLLIKRAKSVWVWPAPDPPYDGLSFKNLTQQIREMKFPTLCEEVYNKMKEEYSYSSTLGVKPTCAVQGKVIGPWIQKLEEEYLGLSLKRFH